MLTTVANLIDDVLLNIFSFLPPAELNTVRQVSRRWHKVLTPAKVQHFTKQLQKILATLNAHEQEQKNSEEEFQLDSQTVRAVATDMVHFYLFNVGQRSVLQKELEGLAGLLQVYIKPNLFEKEHKGTTFLHDTVFVQGLNPLYTSLSQFLNKINIKIEKYSQLHAIDAKTRFEGIDNIYFVLQKMNLELVGNFIRLLLLFSQGQFNSFTEAELGKLLEARTVAKRTIQLDEEEQTKDCARNKCRGFTLLISSFTGLMFSIFGAVLIFLVEGRDKQIICGVIISIGITSLILAAGLIYADRRSKNVLKRSTANFATFFKSAAEDDSIAIDVADETQPLNQGGRHHLHYSSI